MQRFPYVGAISESRCLAKNTLQLITKPDFEQLLPRFASLPPGSLGKKQSTEKSEQKLN